MYWFYEGAYINYIIGIFIFLYIAYDNEDFGEVYYFVF